jgi:hypothetical protein
VTDSESSNLFSATYAYGIAPFQTASTDMDLGFPGTASSFNVGKLASVCTGTGSCPTNCTAAPGYTESETYDSFGRQSTRVITMPQGCGTGTFTYTWG